MDSRLQVQGFGIGLHVGIQSTEEGTYMRPVTDAEERTPLLLGPLTDIDPNAPNEELLFAPHGDLETAANKEPLVVNDAIVTAEGTPLVALTLWNRIVGQGRIGSEGGHPDMCLSACCAS